MHIGVITLLTICAATALACDCGFGKVVSDEPTCRCECDATYVLPTCIFHPSDVAQLYVVLNMTRSEFISDVLIRKIADGMGITDPFQTNFTYRGSAFDSAEAEKYPNNILVQIGCLGSELNALLNNVSAKETWVSGASIVTLYLNPTATNGDVPIIEAVLFDNGRVVVTLGSLYWMIGALVVAVVMLCCEKCWLDCECRCIKCCKGAKEEEPSGCGEPIDVEAGEKDPKKDPDAFDVPVPPVDTCATDAPGPSEPASLDNTTRSSHRTRPKTMSRQGTENEVSDAQEERRRVRHSRRTKAEAVAPAEPQPLEQRPTEQV